MEKPVLRNMHVEDVGAIAPARREEAHDPIARHVAEREPPVGGGDCVGAGHHPNDAAFLERELQPIGGHGSARYW